jgi:hypothetical protein
VKIGCGPGERRRCDEAREFVAETMLEPVVAAGPAADVTQATRLPLQVNAQEAREQEGFAAKPIRQN